jgi:hypothetical protein
MRTDRVAAILLAFACAGVPVLARDPCIESRDPKCIPVQQEHCRQAADEMLRIVRAETPQDPREAAKIRALIARLEKMVAENRRNGVDECLTWGEFGGILAKF